MRKNKRNWGRWKYTQITSRTIKYIRNTQENLIKKQNKRKFVVNNINLSYFTCSAHNKNLKVAKNVPIYKGKCFFFFLYFALKSKPFLLDIHKEKKSVWEEKLSTKEFSLFFLTGLLLEFIDFNSRIFRLLCEINFSKKIL